MKRLICTLLVCALMLSLVPGAALVGSVVPASERNPSITRLPARRIATDGPLIMNSSSGS